VHRNILKDIKARLTESLHSRPLVLAKSLVFLLDVHWLMGFSLIWDSGFVYSEIGAYNPFALSFASEAGLTRA
jgi:hypothetical protein